MTELVFFVEYDMPLPGDRRKVPGKRRLRSRKAVREAYASTRRAVWVSPQGSDLSVLIQHGRAQQAARRLLVLSDLEKAQRELLQASFRLVVSPEKVLRREELSVALLSGNREDLFIGGTVDEPTQALVLYRGNLDQVVVPFRWFTVRKGGPRPRWNQFEVTDFGHTLEFGEYEVATDAILYAFDSDFRKRAKENALKLDESFGGSLKRLRLLRRVSQDDFPGVSRKQISRLEKGETGTPQVATLKKIAKRLGVKPEDIETY